MHIDLIYCALSTFDPLCKSVCVCVCVLVFVCLFTHIHLCVFNCFVILKVVGHMVVGKKVATTSGRQKEDEADTTNIIIQLCEVTGAVTNVSMFCLNLSTSVSL